MLHEISGELSLFNLNHFLLPEEGLGLDIVDGLKGFQSSSSTGSNLKSTVTPLETPETQEIHYLMDWYVILSPTLHTKTFGPKWIRIKGTKVSLQGTPIESIETKEIISSLSKRTVKDVDGVYYSLVGKGDGVELVLSGFEEFRDGFSDDWKDLVLQKQGLRVKPVSVSDVEVGGYDDVDSAIKPTEGIKGSKRAIESAIDRVEGTESAYQEPEREPERKENAVETTAKVVGPKITQATTAKPLLEQELYDDQPVLDYDDFPEPFENVVVKPLERVKKKAKSAAKKSNVKKANTIVESDDEMIARPKKKTIADDVQVSKKKLNLNPTSTTRSGRNVMKPLEWWRNEKAVLL